MLTRNKQVARNSISMAFRNDALNGSKRKELKVLESTEFSQAISLAPPAPSSTLSTVIRDIGMAGNALYEYVCKNQISEMLLNRSTKWFSIVRYIRF
jgi:hypothetical protein